MEIKVGQGWRTRSGEHVSVTGYVKGNDWPWTVYGLNGVRTVNEKGWVSTTEGSNDDLVELISDVPVKLVTEVVGDTVVMRRDTDIQFAAAVEESIADSNELAAETLMALGWIFDGKCWTEEHATQRDSAILSHPLYPIFVQAIEQAMYGKGERHGGNVTPFLDQPWAHYVKLHGRGFATGQSAKKLEEAASLREGKPFDDEVMGAIVYAGMSILKNRGLV